MTDDHQQDDHPWIGGATLDDGSTPVVIVLLPGRVPHVLRNVAAFAIIVDDDGDLASVTAIASDLPDGDAARFLREIAADVDAGLFSDAPTWATR